MRGARLAVTAMCGSGHPWPADYPGLRNGWVGTRSHYKGTGTMEVTVDW